MKTHKVIDTFYTEEEGNDVFVGNLKECQEWISKQGYEYGYVIMPLTQNEENASTS